MGSFPAPDGPGWPHACCGDVEWSPLASEGGAWRRIGCWCAPIDGATSDVCALPDCFCDIPQICGARVCAAHACSHAPPYLSALCGVCGGRVQPGRSGMVSVV